MRLASDSLRFVALAVVASSLTASSLAAQAKVWVVDDSGGPGVDFTSIQAAVDAAASGDTVLVHPGTYAPFTVDGKGLSVLPATSTSPAVAIGATGVSVRNVPANASFVMRGISLGGPLNLAGPDPLRVENCAGSVWCGNGMFWGGSNTIRASDCNLVVLHVVSNVAFSARTSTVALYHTTLFGPPVGAGLPGLAAASFERCTVHGQAAFITGGNGGNGTLDCATTPGNGGTGLQLIDTSADFIASAWSGGGPGAGNLACFGSPGAPAELIGSSTLTSEPGAGPALLESGTATAREGQSLVMSLIGEPGDVALVALAAQPAFASVPGFHGSLVLDSSSLVLGRAFTLGTPAWNQFGVPIQELGPGVQAVQFFAQGVFVKPGYGIQLGSATPVTLLDAAF